MCHVVQMKPAICKLEMRETRPTSIHWRYWEGVPESVRAGHGPEYGVLFIYGNVTDSRMELLLHRLLLLAL